MQIFRFEEIPLAIPVGNKMYLALLKIEAHQPFEDFLHLLWHGGISLQQPRSFQSQFCLLNSGSPFGSTWDSLSLHCVLDILKAVSWINLRVHVICFPSLRDHCFSLPEIQYFNTFSPKIFCLDFVSCLSWRQIQAFLLC